MGVCTVWKRKKATEPALKGRDGTIWDDPGGRGGGVLNGRDGTMIV